jgi:hypothetical protein
MTTNCTELRNKADELERYFGLSESAELMRSASATIDALTLERDQLAKALREILKDDAHGFPVAIIGRQLRDMAIAALDTREQTEK